MMKALVAIAVLVVVGCFGTWIYQDINQQHRLNDANEKAAKICKGNYVSYDVQDQSKMVFACTSDGKLQVIDYGSSL